MSRKCSLETQTGKLFIVIRKNQSIDHKKIDEYCRTFLKSYAWIEHKEDIHPVSKLVEGVHYHIVGNAKSTRQRLITILNNLCDFFNFKDTNGVEVEKYDNFEASLQYLLHLNQPDKTPHKPNELHTNIDKTQLELYLNTEFNSISFDRIYSVCLSSNNIIEVIRSIGLSHYRIYRAVIWDIWTQVLEERRIKEFNNNLKNFPLNGDVS